MTSAELSVITPARCQFVSNVRATKQMLISLKYDSNVQLARQHTVKDQRDLRQGNSDVTFPF